MARRLGDQATLLEVLLRRHLAIRNPDTLADRLADTAEAQALATTLADPITRFWAAFNRMMSVFDAGDFATFTQCREHATMLAEEIGQPTLQWLVQSVGCAAALLAGDAKGAEALAAENFRRGSETGERDAGVLYGAQLLLIRWHEGRDAEVLEHVATMAAENPHLPAVRSALARMYADSGRDDMAQELLTAEAAAGFPHPHDYLLLAYLSNWAEVAAHVGERAAAEALRERLGRWPDQVISVGLGVLGGTAHYLGILESVLGRYEASEVHFARAQALHERLQAPFHLARTHLEWGRMLMIWDPTGAEATERGHLETAQRLARDYGCAVVERRADCLLQQLATAG